MDKKVWCSLGDSITYQNKWQPFVAEKLHLRHINCGIGSTTVSRPKKSLPNPAFYTDERLGLGKYSDVKKTTLENGVEYNLVIPNKPDFVTIMGGGNDSLFGYEIGEERELEKDISTKKLDTFIGAYSYIIEKLLTNDPLLKIAIISLFQTFSNTSYKRAFTKEELFTATKKVADYYALPFVDLKHTCGFNCITKDVYLPDGVHPNELGGKRIAEIVLRVLSYNL